MRTSWTLPRQSSTMFSVLRQRGTRADALHDILRLRIVISTSMVVVVAALIPVGLTSFHFSERVFQYVWRTPVHCLSIRV